MLVKTIKHKKIKLVYLIIVVISVVLISLAFWFLFRGSTNTSDNAKQPDAVLLPTPKVISSNILFSGNTYWGRYINDWSMASSLKYAYPFSRLGEFNRSQYDAWISGLECPSIDGVSMTSAEEDATLQFNCSPKYLPEAAKWFTAFTLATNHTDNQGPEGFAETRAHLEENGIQYFGHYDPRKLDDVCEVISLPVTIENKDMTTERGKLPIAMCGYNGVFMIPSEPSIEEIGKYSQYMPVIAMPHMGAEYKTKSDEIRQNFYHSLIDGGADMVLGDHPHWIQETESYQGHLIVYSMGNFIFDQQSNSEVTRSAAIKLLMKTNNNDPDLLKAWLAIGENCSVFKDECLAQVKQQKLSKLDISYQFGVVGVNNSGKITKPSTTEQQTGILQRLNWQTTMNNLQPPYSSL